MKSRFLSRALAVNSGFSALTGIALILGAITVSDWFGVPPWLAIVIGVGLLPFALLVARTAQDPEPPRVVGVVVADVFWVVAALTVLVGFPGAMSAQGSWALGAVTVVVGILAVLQVVGLRGEVGAG